MTRFDKTFATREQAQEALRRSEMLHAGGIRTPGACPGRTEAKLSFGKIDGESRFALLTAVPMHALLAPLTALHDLPATGIPRFDPLARIAPRLGPDMPPWLGDSLAHLTTGLPEGNTLLHGDFHVGQLIRDGSGEIWIVDLDDLALGPPEADLGNFVAHLATSPEASDGTFREGLCRCRGEVLSAWHRLGRHCDVAAFNRFLALALIRRYLKLREAGRPDHGEMIAREVSVP